MQLEMIEKRLKEGRYLKLAPLNNGEAIPHYGHHHILVNYEIGNKLRDAIRTKIDNELSPSHRISENRSLLRSHGVYTYGLFRETETVTHSLMQQILKSELIGSYAVDTRPKYFEVSKLYSINYEVNTLAQLFELISPLETSATDITSDAKEVGT